MNKYLLILLTAFGVTYVLTPAVRALALRFGAVDQPGERRPHKRPTARGGGLAVVLGVHAACWLALLLPWGGGPSGFDFHWWKHFTAASLVLLVVGLVDDVRGLSPLVKLAGQTLAASLIALSGLQFGRLFGIELPGLLDRILVVFWIVSIINAFNLIDGLDGLASGLAIISAVGLCGVFVLGRLPGDIIPLLALIGACLAFLRYNFHPASIFLGDTGSMFLGFTLGVISLQTFSKSTFMLSLTIPLLVLGVPIYDALLAIWRRSVRRWLSGLPFDGNGKRASLMQPDLDHLHHRLAKSGWTTRRVATVLCMGNATLVVFGLLITSFQSHATGIFLIALLSGVYVLMRHLAVLELRETGKAILSGLRRPGHPTLKALAYPIWDMLWMAGAVGFVMWTVEAVPRLGFWKAWFLDLPVWVTPTFSLLALSRVYEIVWSRARGRDVFLLVLMLQLGLLLSLGIALLIDPLALQTWFFRTLLLGALSHPAMISVRVIYRVIEELVIWWRIQTEQRQDDNRILLYGAGGRCQLFLRERSFSNSSSFDARAILGLIDDDLTLHGRWVYGYMVLGGSKDLPKIIARDHITGIIITAMLSSESQAVVEELARQPGIQLSEWRFEELQLSIPVVRSQPLETPLAVR